MRISDSWRLIYNVAQGMYQGLGYKEGCDFDTMIALHLVFVALISYKLFNEYFVKWNKVNKKNVAF